MKAPTHLSNITCPLSGSLSVDFFLHCSLAFIYCYKRIVAVFCLALVVSEILSLLLLSFVRGSNPVQLQFFPFEVLTGFANCTNQAFRILTCSISNPTQPHTRGGVRRRSGVIGERRRDGGVRVRNQPSLTYRAGGGDRVE